MPIDLPASSQINARGNQNPLTQASNQRQDAMQAALRALNIKVGDTTTAIVRQVNSVDEQLRIRLINLANPVTRSAEAGLARPAGSSSPSTPLSSDQLMTLLKSSTLKLVEIEVKGKTLLAFTDRAVKTGSKLPVELQRNGLLLLNSSPKSPLSAQPGPQGQTQGQLSSASSSYTQIENQNQRVDTASTRQAPLPTSAPNTQKLDGLQLATLQQALRASIPQQDANRSAMTETLTVAQQLSEQLRQPASSGLRQQLPASLQQSLHILASHLRTAEQLSHPGTVKNALLNGGMRLEQTLLNKPLLSSAPSADIKTSQGNGNSAELGKILARQDLKAALLYLLTQIPQSASTVPSAQNGPVNSPAESLFLLLQQFTGKSRRDSGSSSNSPKDQLFQAIQQQVFKALGKLSLQQLQSLQRSHTSAEGVNTQHWQVEIPIRYGHEVQQLALRIDEEWVNEHQSSDNESPAKIRQWLIKLAFDLPQAGAFHAHLIIVNDSVTASLWAENPITLHKTQQKLGQLQQRLQHDGIEVKKIECFPGKPVEEKITMNYSLVDIKT